MALAATLARRRPYYGWYIVAVLFVSSFLSAGLNANAPGLFLKPMTQDLHWSRGFFSTVVSLGTLLSTPLAMIVWPLVDRKGPRGVMLVSGLIFGLGTAAQGLVQTRWQFFLVKSLVLPFGTVGIGPLIAMLVVTQWFVKRRGRALAITAMGASLAGILTPPIATYLIFAVGWRAAWVIMGLVGAALSVATVAVFMRRSPEDLGLSPDGGAAAASAPGLSGPPSQATSWTRRDILRTPVFWLLPFAIPLGYLAQGVVNQHLPAYVSDPEVGFSQQTGAMLLMVLFSFSLGIKVPLGLVMERVPIKYCFAFSFACIGLGMATILMARANLPGLIAGVALIGMGWGGSTPLQGMIWVDYYGRSSQGMARSLATPVTNASAVVGPMLAGFIWDMTGTYRGIFSAYIATPVLGILLILLTRTPKKSTRPEPSVEGGR